MHDTCGTVYQEVVYFKMIHSNSMHIYNKFSKLIANKRNMESCCKHFRHIVSEPAFQNEVVRALTVLGMDAVAAVGCLSIII